MSAANAHYIVKKGNQWSVRYGYASCMSESGTQYDPEGTYRKFLFDRGKKFDTETEAILYALMQENWMATEYGVVDGGEL